MDGLLIRESKWSDLDEIERRIRPQGQALREFQTYRHLYFTESGQPKTVRTGYPDTILVAERRGSIIGYLHFYTDCWDGYETTLIACATDPALGSHEAMIVRGELELAWRLHEP